MASRRKRRYRWSHGFGTHTLISNTLVRITRNYGSWTLRIGDREIGIYRTFALAEGAVPTEALQDRSTNPHS